MALKTVAREGRTQVVEEDISKSREYRKETKASVAVLFFPSFSMWLKPNQIHLNTNQQIKAVLNVKICILYPLFWYVTGGFNRKTMSLFFHPYTISC